MTIGERLKAYAKARCGSMKRLAEDLGGIRPDNLQKYASGKNEPGAKLLRQLIEHGCSATWLLTGKGSMLVEDTGDEAMSIEERKMLEVLKSLGITDANTLEALIADFQAILTAHESLQSKLGNGIPETSVIKTKKSGR